MSTSIRLFVAVYPPRELASAMLEVMETAVRVHHLPAHRATPVEQVHLTLQFIGETPVAKLDKVTESVTRAASGLACASVLPTQLIALPARGPTRLLAVETDRPPALCELKRRLAGRLSRAPRRDTADRYRPHITVCRFRTPTRIPDIADPVTLAAFTMEKIALMRSSLRPDGAVHLTIAEISLDT